MGLNISVGLLADLAENDEAGAAWLRSVFQGINDVLAEGDLPTYAEPEQLEPMHSRAETNTFPYGFLHYLRRFYARVEYDPDWIPELVADSDSPIDDPVLSEAMYQMTSHLLCHSDSEGFYLPIVLEEIVVDVSGADRIPGGIVGSSYALRQELMAIAPSLGIKLRGGQLSDDEATRINGLVAKETGFWVELMVWMALFEAARLSIEHGTAIAFT
jgi:hypothetical protein